MKKHGSIVRWDAASAVGLIRSPDTAAEVVFHLRDYEGPQPITIGTAVVFQEIVVGGKGPRALSVQLPPPPPLRVATPPAEDAPDPVLPPAAPSAAQRWREQRAARRQSNLALGLLGGWLLLWLIGIVSGRLPWVVLTGLVLVNIAAVFLHWRDQRVATEGGAPWPQEVLHLSALLGGWPAGWFTQRALQHRLEERGFQRRFIACAVLNVLGLALWLGWPLFTRA